jgi:hypothetical protein
MGSNMSKADANQSRKELTGHLVDLLRHADRLDRRGHTDSALDLLFDQIDEMLLASDFSRVDRLLLETAPESLSVDLLIGLLTATLPAKDRLPNRKYFLERVERSLQERGELESGLLVGLD